MNRITTLLLLAALTAPAFAQRVLRVGTGQEYKTLAGLPLLRGGDVVEISPGTYPGIKLFKATNGADKPITIRGVGGRPSIDGNGSSARGLLEFQGAAAAGLGYFILEDLDVSYIWNGSLNSACIRNVSAASLMIRRVKVRGCDMGIFTSEPSGDTIVEDSDVGFNGRGALGHNVYAHGQKFVIRRSRIHNSLGGQNIKCRSRICEITDNYVWNGNDGEVEFVDGLYTTTAGSDAVMTGNLVVSKAVRSGGSNCCRFSNFGKSGETSPDRVGTFVLRNNTFISRNARHIFVTIASSNAKLLSVGNSFQSPVTVTKALLLRDRYGAKSITSANDFILPVGSPVLARFMPALPVPAVPTAVKAEIVSKWISVSWNPVQGAAHYKVYSQRQNSEGKLTAYLLRGASETAEFRDLLSLTSGKINNYVVVAVNSEDAESPKSQPITFVIP
jgi:hypothetical protein